ncbi:murein biosynthesis integral membrane protein MurJ [Dictyobacter formicarum]|uniref:Lipid II flippase MurJ n=1 Tax=Dictyobacter formicarum TaxID=2778368 RepID=A0ABQ3VTS9_9CHLR|nr:polysaccharide biosynthesis protein [Dictyobacter formicarum]GHO89034.1 putative lipid II flippase MurJ [Dictyobacter formicarum]
MAKDSIDKEIFSSQNDQNDVPVEAVPTVLGGGNVDSETAMEVIDSTSAAIKEDEVAAVPAPENAVAEEQAVAPPSTETGIKSDRKELVKSASLVALGNLGSSVLGMLRQSFIAYTGSGISGPFFASLSPAQKFNDFIVNGSVPGALIPTFNDYAENREALRRLVFTIVNLVLVIMAISSVGYFFLAPWFTNTILAAGFPPQQKLLTLNFTRIVFFSLLALGPFAVLQAALYAQKEFGWTAFAAAAYHAGIIVGAIFTGVIGKQFFGLGQYGLAFGVILGTVGEIVLLIPGMRNQHMRYMFVLDLKHPALRRILKLYGPVAFSFLFSACVAFLDQFLTTKTPCIDAMQQLKNCGDANLSAMGFATLLIQFPGGLVASALSFAVLPTLTTYMREGDIERFKSTLLLGFRLGLLLMVPAAAGLIILKLPIVTMLFQHGKFSPAQSIVTSLALQNFSYQLPFIAIDQLLIAAFYARKNTIIPVAVLVLSVFGYLAVALPFWHSIGVPAMAFANTVQNTLHPLILLLILWKTIGSLHLRGVLPALLKILLATAGMVAVAWGLQLILAHIHLFSLSTFVGSVLTVIVAGGIAAAVYFVLVIAFKVEEVSMLKGAVLAKLGKK